MHKILNAHEAYSQTLHTTGQQYKTT